MIISEKEKELCRELRNFPRRSAYRWNPHAKSRLLQVLFFSLAQNDLACLQTLFGGSGLSTDKPWVLRDHQGAEEGSEYSIHARGKPCGHIFKSGEATYRCKTCTADDTCVLCSKCFDASDHTGHMVYVNISPGNSGCCDCGDDEAWQRPVNCAIHTESPDSNIAGHRGKEGQRVSEEWAEAIRMTIGRALDYVCDVISCSPEQLRLKKSESSIREDERASRLTSKWYDDEDLDADEDIEWALVLWNDEKHSLEEVENQVARACRQAKSFGLEKARETDDIGRSVVMYSNDLKTLLDAAIIIEKIKITVTIRSARDTFREQMCSTIIEWLLDIVGCHVGTDNHILQETVCKELLKPWRTGSKASNANVGRCGIDDHELEDYRRERAMFAGRTVHDIQVGPNGGVALTMLATAGDAEEEPATDGADDPNAAPDTETREAVNEDMMDLDSSDVDGDLDMRPAAERNPDDDLEVSEATLAGYPPPPPPPPAQTTRTRLFTPNNVDNVEEPSSASSTPRAVVQVPKTPWSHKRAIHQRPAPMHWIDKAWSPPSDLLLAEDVRQRVRLDWLILFDLRLWKKTRVDLRDLYISTVVTVPAFKRVLGLRFAGLYPVLAQLYLIADREPDHSIVYLSVQMLTTPSITREIVEKGNFLTNLFAILYTFLTTRQVGHPWEVNPNATLAFDTGSVTNRRMYHFFTDIKHLFALDYICAQLREDRRYPLQFLDLIKLPQGICPNKRAVGEHVEYETDTWISASILTRELNRLCRLFAEAFKCKRGDDFSSIGDAIRTFVRAAIINSIGAERARFKDSEISKEIKFKSMEGVGFQLEGGGLSFEPATMYQIVDFVVQKESISFHHALHYTISWLIEGAKSMDASRLRDLVCFTAEDLQQNSVTLPYVSTIPVHEPESYLMAFFDFPIRICAWLAQMKAGMWVRNGLSLRHQMSTYRGVAQRDLAHHRDIFLLQTALVTCNPSRVLLSMVDRFELGDWMVGRFVLPEGYEEGQMVDVAEDFIHLLIVLLIERTSLVPIEDDPNPQNLAVRRDIIHTLCFKPLSFSDLCNRLADRFQDLDDFQEVLDGMTNFKPPEGLSDSGTFELKPEYLAELDPYALHYNKSQRDESDAAYRKWVAKSTGKPANEVVLEPKIRPIRSGLFRKLGDFTRTEIFAQIIYFSLKWALTSREHSRNTLMTRVEAFLQLVLHLVFATVLEDSSEDETPISTPESSEDIQFNLVGKSFINRMLFESPSEHDSIFMSLQGILAREDMSSCHLKTRAILSHVQKKKPNAFARIVTAKGILADRLGADSPMSMSSEDAEAKKKQALERQAKVMAQFQKQQQDFLNSQANFDWGEEDFEADENDTSATSQEQNKMWKYPSGNCILCQEETNDGRFYGTFALFHQSRIVRQTDLQDEDFVREVVDQPRSLDRSAEAIRPYGVAGQNRHLIKKITSEGTEIVCQRQTLGKGFNSKYCREGPVSVGCGHIMHYDCFEMFCSSLSRRHTHQVARHHAERLELNEYFCPLCKALGNTFLPIIWKGKEESYPGVLQTAVPFHEWLDSHVGVTASRYHKQPDRGHMMNQRQQETFRGALADTIVAPAADTVVPALSEQFPLFPFSTSTSGSSVPGGRPETVPHAGDIPSESLALEELFSIYQRMRDSVMKNNLHSRFAYRPESVSEDLIFTDTLVTVLSYSIAATEISQRGVESGPGSLLLDTIPSLTLTHLRILSESTSTYIAVGGLRRRGENFASDEFLISHRRQLLQIFAGHPQIHDDDPWVPNSAHAPRVPAALSEDPFTLLAETSFYLVPALNLDIHHVVRLHYLMEIVKAVLSFHCSPNVTDILSRMKVPAQVDHLGSESLDVFTKLLRFIERAGHLPAPLSNAGPRILSKMYNMVSAYALAFLRKSAILLHVRYGVDFPSQGYACLEDSEAERLARAMRLPTIPSLMKYVVEGAVNEDPTVLQSMVQSWVRHWRWMILQQNLAQKGIDGIRPSHPCIFELIGLPKYYDSLIEETMRRRCPNTGKELVEPALCLFCGDIFCSQAVCCSKGGKGGCNQHMRACGGNIGIFIALRKCVVLYLHDRNGSWAHAPYLDKHGEVDPGLRRSRQLMLNEKRYDALLRSVWLQHNVPTTITRKLEPEINNGGWETM